MAVGQAVLSGTLDVGAVDALESRLVERERQRCAEHASALRDALELLRLYERAGMWLAVPSQLALLGDAGDVAADDRPGAGRSRGRVPPARGRVLTVEQAGAVGRVLDPLPGEVRDAVWARAVARLTVDEEQGRMTPPARLSELLRTWAVQVDPDAAADRRRAAEAAGSGLLHRRDDGLNDVVLSGLTAPLAEGAVPGHGRGDAGRVRR